MAKRREFSAAVRTPVIKRSTRDKVVYCEQCSLPAKRFQIDHIRPDGLLGEPVLSNAQLLCEVCFGVKNPADASSIARAKRQQNGELRANKPIAPDKQLQGQPMPTTRKAADRAARGHKPQVRRARPWVRGEGAAS